MAIILHEPFSPLMIPGCALWLEADREVDTVDGKVSLWKDQSGNGRHASQSEAAKRPPYNVTQINSRPTLEHVDGTAQYLSNASISGLDALTKCSLFFVGQFRQFNDERHTLWITSYAMSLGTFSAAGQSKLFIPSSSSSWLAWDYTSTAPMVLIAVYDGSLSANNRMKVWINGAAISGAINSTIPTSLPNITNMTILPTYTNASQVIATLGLHTVAYSDSERQRLQYSYSHKYGIALAA